MPGAGRPADRPVAAPADRQVAAPLTHRPPQPAATRPYRPQLLYLDQNYLSGIAKRKPAFVELEPVLRAAIARNAIAVAESPMHEQESHPRPDLGLLELLRELSGGRRLPDQPPRAALRARRRMAWTVEHELPDRRPRASDAADLDAIALALTHCDLVTCDAFMCDVVKRSRLEIRYGSELFTGRRRDVVRLRRRLIELAEAIH